MQTNTFQCVFATDGYDSFAIYLYADGLIQWTSGDDSGGINGIGGNAASVGFSSLDGINFYNVPESGTAAIINITLTSNANIPGVWMFRVSGKGKVHVIICVVKTCNTYSHNLLLL